jgi:hypothetical protein
MSRRRDWISSCAVTERKKDCAMIYILGPIIMYIMAFSPGGSSTELTSPPVSIPSLLSAAERAIPALTRGFHCPTFRSKSISDGLTVTVIPTPKPVVMARMSMKAGHSTSFHPASIRIIPMHSLRSVSSEWKKLTSITYCVPANCSSSSAIWPILLRVKPLGALSFASARFASAARASASIAFWFASATRTFERRCNLSLAAPAFPPERSAPYTPATIARLAIVFKSFSATDFPQPKTHRSPASKINPAMMSHSHQPSARACLARSAQSLSSLSVVLGFVRIKRYPYAPRRYRDRQFWIGIGLWVAFALLMFYLLFCFRPHP